MSTRVDLAASYDLDVEFFRLWLDESLGYTCGLHEGTSSEEEAQSKKFDWLAQAADARPGKRILDVGCGWGGGLAHLSRARGVDEAAGITLSKAQFEEVQRKRLPRVRVELVDYREYEPEAPFDGLISAGMFEHLATPEEKRAGRHIDVYRRYFARLHGWTRPGAGFGLQCIVNLRLPRTPRAAREISWLSRTIFPGAQTPWVSDVVASLVPRWELLELQMRRPDYALTTGEWLRRLRDAKAEICRRWGDDRFVEYERYLTSSQEAFQEGYLSLAQFRLARID